ncbi:DUF4931 domain-containing protein [Pseudalkalibacillus caeni]|uniref:DUF4931 domain-containing protein n=1 Tax=Exobacillus caeni TaxID=2574798 RepID=A0A5R9EZ69_9BACL|nr:DUF4931 domain-containing protein [Pseudalkalibacillus caeni]TLS36592.1 DUF4931 domain-containing protein [Pseudalkalibacillus caeni]
MNSKTHLVFDSHLGRQKPESIVNRKAACPFCDRENLTDIIAEDGPIILLKNKYPTLQNTYQTVLIETQQCDGELSLYPKEDLYRVIRFGIRQWLEMVNSKQYQSVLFYKNHGPLSGGTIAHPHMQIVGLEQVDYHQYVNEEQFEGITIAEEKSVRFTISTKPRMGFYEFNSIMGDLKDIEVFSDYIQDAVHYVLHHFHSKCNSYNLFFYQIKGKIAAKVIPRFPASPLFVGYSIPQVANRVGEVAEQIKKIYHYA